jgi:hypothetical protein
MTKKLIVGLCMFFIACSVVAKPKEYKILGQRVKGSKFRHVEATSPIPFNRRYDQLNDEQLKAYRFLYQTLTEHKLADTEVPPFPKKTLNSIYKPLLIAHKGIARGGMLFLVAEIDETGKTETVTVYQSPARQTTRYITALIFETEFDPGTCDGKPCTMEFPFEIDLRRFHRNLDLTGGHPSAPSNGQPR